MREGVSASRVAVTAGAWPDVAAFLAHRLPAGRDWLPRLARGEVLDAEGQPVLPHAPCRVGAFLWYWRDVPLEPRVPFEIDVLHQDAHLVAVDKPHFLPVTPGGRHLQETVLVRLKRQLGIETLVPMHRLDLETAGVLLFTVQPETRHAYQSLLRDRAVHKVYEAVAAWRPELCVPLVYRHRLEERAGDGFLQMAVVPGEANAETLVECLGSVDAPPATWGVEPHNPYSASLAIAGGPEVLSATGWALYRLTPRTGRKHQLRAQMNALGLPLAGDRIYPTLQPQRPAGAAPDYTRPLQLLAREVAFTDPLSGEWRRFLSRRRLALDTRAEQPSHTAP